MNRAMSSKVAHILHATVTNFTLLLPLNGQLVLLLGDPFVATEVCAQSDSLAGLHNSFHQIIATPLRNPPMVSFMPGKLLHLLVASALTCARFKDIYPLSYITLEASFRATICLRGPIPKPLVESPDHGLTNRLISDQFLDQAFV